MSKVSPCGLRHDARPAHVSVRVLFTITAGLVLTSSPGCRTTKQRPSPQATVPPAKIAAAREVAPHPPLARVWVSRANLAAEDAGPEVEWYAGPLITDRVIYRVPHEGGAVRAVDPRTGKVLWQKQTERYAHFGPVCDGRTVYLPITGRLVACDPLSGHERWSVPLADLDTGHGQGSDITPIAAWPGTVFYHSNGSIVAFDTIKRKRTWTVSLSYMVEPFRTVGWPRPYIRPIIAAGRYLVVTYYFGIGCIEIKTGRLRWRYPPDLGYITEYNGVGAMAADGARLYFADPEVGARDLRTGRLLWKAASGRGPVTEAPALLDGLALFVDKDGWLHAVSAADGKPRWKFRSPEGKLYLSGPTVYGGEIFLHTGKALIALDASGKQLWTWPTQAGDTPNPTRISVFNDGVLLHERGSFVYYAMVKPRASKPKAH